MLWEHPQDHFHHGPNGNFLQIMKLVTFIESPAPYRHYTLGGGRLYREGRAVRCGGGAGEAGVDAGVVQ